jgi:hypothetical protein
MNIVLECEVTLPKKLEKLCDQGEHITLHITNVSGNKGIGLMKLVSSTKDAVKDISAIGETSLMFKIGKVEEDIPDFPHEVGVGNLFRGKIDRHGQAERLMARVDPDEGEEEGYSGRPDGEVVAPRREAPRPQAPKSPSVFRVDEARAAEASSAPETRVASRCVSSLEELDEALTKVKSIDKEVAIPADGRKLSRSEAIKIEMSVARMSDRCYVRNMLPSTLLVNDIEMSHGHSLALLPGQVMELSRFPAKKIRDSADLRWCIEKGYLTFASQQEYVESFNKLAKAKNRADQSPLPVYDSRDKAIDAVRGAFASDRDDPQTIDVDDGKDIPFENDPTMDKLVGTLPRG